MDDIELKRDYVASLYPGQGWKDRVKRMSDDQVIAIYLRKKQGEETLNENSKESDPDAPTLF